MQVTSNTYSNYNQTSTVTKTAEVKETSFASMLSTPEDTTIKKSEGMFLKFMDQYNAFDLLSEENRTVFREILNDDEITMSEMDSLSYEQATLFLDYILPPGTMVHKDDIGKMPIVHKSSQIGAMLFTTRLTNDDTFNESLYRTAREIDDDIFRMNILDAVKTNVAQVLYDYETLSSDNPDSSVPYNQWDWDYETMDINFSKFLSDVSNLLQDSIDNAKYKEYKEQQQKTLDGYNIISKHYYDIQSQNININ